MFQGLVLILLILSCESNNEKKQDVFVATNEWQVLPKGQKIPKGLHVRINFETGITEAKLLDENDESPNALIAIDKPEEPINLSIKDEKMLKDKLKPYKKLKHNLKKSNLHIKNETPVLYNLINDDSIGGLEQIKGLLNELDKPPDISDDFIKLEGFEKLIYPNFNASNEDVLSCTLNFLGTLSQNNPIVKIYALETGSLIYLQRFLTKKSNEIKSKAVFALGSILRQFPYAQLKFLNNGGFVSLIDAMRSEDAAMKLKLKIMLLLNDLIIEYKMSFNVKEDNKYEKIETIHNIILLGYCEELNNLIKILSKFVGQNFDEIEKCVVAMKAVEKECTFFKDDKTVRFLLKLSQHLENTKEDEIYPELIAILNEIKKNSTRVEL